MNKIEDYKLIRANKVEELEAEVLDFIDSGYVLYFNHYVVDNTHYQAMIKYSTNETV